MLKLMQQAVPHAVGGTTVYTTYTYDGIGRTVSVVAPDGVSATTYGYQGNTVTTTDPAGKWKTFTMDALGHLTQVVEPDPANPTRSTYVTTYTYDLWDNLNTVTMPRPTGTQTRTFTYNGPYLQSATNPENGTVTYGYNSYNQLTTKTDAKGQQFAYTYDSYARLTGIQVYPQGPNNPADPCQAVTYYYDTNPFDSSYSGAYSAGRLTAIQYYGGSSTYAASPGQCDTTFTEMYDYSQPGGKIGKLLQVARSLYTGSQYLGYTTINVDLNSSYTYDNEGRMTSVQYPNSGTSSSPIAGPNLGWAYDTMGRLNTMTDLAAQTGIIGGATYNPANQLLTMSGLVNETRTYNSMLQLTGLTAPNVNISYYYYNSVQNNNGKVTAQVDGISGEQVNYTYDALNRLASAATSYQANVPQWGQSYTYDGFGNLTGQTVTQGSAPAFSAVYDPSTNHPAAGFGSVDANGNLLLYADGGIVAYDGRNRMIGVIGNYQYSYDPSNKRVWRGVWTNGTLTTDEVTFWSVSGQKLATYQMNVTQNVNPPVMYASQTGTNYYFGAKLIKNAGGYVGADRLGSIGHFYPWGQEKPSATQNGTEKFTGYFRDAETGLDYADQRYHVPGTGRFLTPDPYKSNGGGAGDSTNPISWNKYAYALGDPVRYRDPHGLFSCDGDYEDGDEDFTSSDCGLDESDITGPETCGDGQHFEETTNSCVDNSTDNDDDEEAWQCPPQYQAWINTYGANAVATGLSESNVLALSAIESGWGTGRFATQGHDFFNLETVWKPGTPQPAPKYAYQTGWLQAKEMFTSGPSKGKYSLVATYKSASDSFKSFAATFGAVFAGVTDAATFGKIAVANGEYGGRGNDFVTTAQTFMDCLGHN